MCLFGMGLYVLVDAHLRTKDALSLLTLGKPPYDTVSTFDTYLSILAIFNSVICCKRALKYFWQGAFSHVE